MLDNKQLWESTLIEIELNLSKANFSTWFKNTSVYKQDDGIIFLSVPNAFVKDWLVNKYHKFILKSLRGVAQEVRGVEYIIEKECRPINLQQEKRLFPSIQANHLGLDNFYINREDNLNPKYTFENFIVGSFNDLAYAAAQAIIKKPGMVYNPLFIYGGTGLGKTHLIQAIGNHIKNVLNKKVLYITSESFAQELVDSLRSGTIHNFKNKYRKYDALIMDDVQFFSTKEKTQEELFHTFNSLYENNKQIIFSSDKPPSHIADLEERLRSRFEGGMIVDISKPEFESRTMILAAKAKIMGCPLPDDVLSFLASSIKDNIRELEGALNAVVCQMQLKNRELSLNEIKSLVKTSIKPPKTISVKDIARIVSGFYNIDEASLYEKTRRKEVVKPRQIVMFILREDFNTSYPYIGQKMGGRDHTTVIHACDKIKKDMTNNPVLEKEIAEIKELIYSSEAISVENPV